MRFTLADNFYALPGVAGGGDRVGLGEVKFLGQPVRDPYIQSPVQITRPFAALEEFDVPVRLASDRMDVSLSGVRSGEIPSVPLVEVRE